MNLFFRFLRIFLPAFFTKKRTGLMDVHTVRSSVWIGDQDPLGHMTNSRYSSFTDLGTMNYMGRTGALMTYRKRGWSPIIQHESITFYRMMKFPQKFELTTQLVGWADCYICFRHQFHSKGKLIAESRMVARLVGRGGPSQRHEPRGGTRERRVAPEHVRRFGSGQSSSTAKSSI